MLGRNCVCLVGCVSVCDSYLQEAGMRGKGLCLWFELVGVFFFHLYVSGI